MSLNAVQPGLFNQAALEAPAPVRRKGPDTSAEAAQILDGTGRATGLRRDALRWLLNQGDDGGTFWEWATSLGIGGPHSGRFTELAAAGFITDTGQRRACQGHGRGRVFRITGLGRDALERKP